MFLFPFQPSDTYRYNALSFTSLATKYRKLASDQEGGNISNVDQKVTADSRVMGQHKVSTLRILSRLMSFVHQDVYNNASDDLNEDDLWRNLWFDLDEELWSIPSSEIRFDWVVHYVRKGSFPKEASYLADVFRQVWNQDGSILRTVNHPYNHDVDVPRKNLLNPDLSPRWIYELIK